MRIVYHLGVHCTDEERLLRCLLKNRAALAADGILVPGPAKYRTLLRDTAMQLKGQTASTETQSLLLDQILAGDTAERLILSWDNFLGYARGAVRAQFYPAGPERMQAFNAVFPDTPSEFHLGIRNPATFLPAVYQKQQGHTLEEFMEGVDLLSLRWSDLITGLADANPDTPITVWCDEDTPLLWPEVLQTVSGHSPGLTLDESDDLLTSLLSDEGKTRMNSYLTTHPPQNKAQSRRIASAFLDKFALPEQINVEVEMPGWTEDLMAEVSTAYDLDVARIIAMPGVKFLTP